MARSPASYHTVKRIVDIAGATALLLGLAPVLGLIAACIWWDDGTPVLFKQVRAGQNEEPFQILKFRTLSTERKDPTRPSDYTTRIGSLLRRWGIDELPQLWNVLRGEMSLVGPRPPLPEDVKQYTVRERIRLQVRPGITGWAQIHGRNAIPWPERIDLDIWYVHNRCLRIDLYVLLQTPIILLSGTGVTGPEGRNPTYH